MTPTHNTGRAGVSAVDHPWPATHIAHVRILVAASRSRAHLVARHVAERGQYVRRRAVFHDSSHPGDDGRTAVHDRLARRDADCHVRRADLGRAWRRAARQRRHVSLPSRNFSRLGLGTLSAVSVHLAIPIQRNIGGGLRLHRCIAIHANVVAWRERVVASAGTGGPYRHLESCRQSSYRCAGHAFRGRNLLGVLPANPFAGSVGNISHSGCVGCRRHRDCAGDVELRPQLDHVSA